MEITLTEALRIKNEIANAVKTLNYNINQASFGDTKEDNEIVSNEKVESFEIVEEKLIKALSFSEEINNKISSFNKENLVDTIVRKMQNSKLLLDIYNRNLTKTKPSKQSRFENLGNGTRKSITIEYIPTVSSKDIKNRVSVQKSVIRDLQSKIEKLNQNKIEVSFDYNDIENLVN